MGSRSKTKVTISPQFHRESDSSRECGLVILAAPLLLPLPVRRQDGQAAQELKRRQWPKTGEKWASVCDYSV